MNLSEAQWRTLDQIKRRSTWPAIRFPTGEALRKHGLVERETLYIVKRVYANNTGEHVQFEGREDDPAIWHDWWITKAGNAVLLEAKP